MTPITNLRGHPLSLRGDDPLRSPAMEGLRPSIASPREDAAKTGRRFAPRAVAEVNALWLMWAGGPQPGPPRAMAWVRELSIGFWERRVMMMTRPDGGVRWPHVASGSGGLSHFRRRKDSSKLRLTS